MLKKLVILGFSIYLLQQIMGKTLLQWNNWALQKLRLVCLLHVFIIRSQLHNGSHYLVSAKVKLSSDFGNTCINRVLWNDFFPWQGETGSCAQTEADVCSHGAILSNELERLLQLTDLKLCLSIFIAGRDEYLIKDGYNINPADNKQLRAQET